MRRSPIRIRAFILGTVLVLLLAPAVAAGAAWVIERDRQQADIQRRLSTVVTYLASHRAELRDPTTAQTLALTRLLDRLELLAQLVLVTTTPPGKDQIFVSPALEQGQPSQLKAHLAGQTSQSAPPEPSATWAHDRQRMLAFGSRKSPATLVTDLYYRPASRTARALVALLTGIVVLLAGLGGAVWLAGRWLVSPLARLSRQVDKVAGGELAIDVPSSRIGEITNIAQAVEGMTAALGDSAQRRAEADEARRFLVTSIAHDLRTPLFALRGHLQAIGSRLGDPAVHLERAEARADALERLIGNLFAYTRDADAEPALRLESLGVAELLDEVTAGLEHATRIRGTTFDLHGDRATAAIADRDRFKRALTNILDNALRFSPPGAAVHVRWSARDESTVAIAVRDHGPGFDPDLLPHVFEPGVRGTPAAGSSDDGAGLGLTIARRLLQHQNATLTAANHPTGGAVISLVIPRGDESERRIRDGSQPGGGVEP